MLNKPERQKRQTNVISVCRKTTQEYFSALVAADTSNAVPKLLSDQELLKVYELRTP